MKHSLIARLNNKEVIKVRMSIGDTCGNGYDEIGITMDTYSKNKRVGEEKIKFEGETYYMESCGLDKEEIIKHFPDLEPILKVNGADMFGFHSYPIMNTRYHLKESKEYVQDLYSFTDEEMKTMPRLNDVAFAEEMHRISNERLIPNIKKAVKVIEKYCDEKYIQKEFISHQLENDIVFEITSKVDKKERGWNLLKGEEKPKKYSIKLG